MRSPEFPQSTRNVLVAVDVQNDFVSGSLTVPEGRDVIRPINELAEDVRESDGTVIFTRDWHPVVTPHFEKWPVHCVQGTDGARFHPALDVRREDIILSKGQGQTDGYSAAEGRTDFGETLETLLRPQTREQQVRVFFGGLATDYCVLNSALDTARMFRTNDRVELYVVRDAIRAVDLNAGDGYNALLAMQQAGLQALTSHEIRERFF